MEKSSFAMAKFGLEHKEAMPKRDCGFYLKYIFLFTSLIQFLIILGLVLFMVYGNAQAGTDTHLRLLEEQVQSHYRRIVALGATNANLSRTLNATLKDRDKVQGMALKAQRELEKCNSSQASSSIPQVSPGSWESRGRVALPAADAAVASSSLWVVAARGPQKVPGGFGQGGPNLLFLLLLFLPGALSEPLKWCPGILLGWSDPSPPPPLPLVALELSQRPRNGAWESFWDVLTLLLFSSSSSSCCPGALPEPTRRCRGVLLGFSDPSPPPLPLPPVQLRELVFQQLRLKECQVITTLINNTCTAEKLQLQRQLDQASLSKRTLEGSRQQSQAELTKVTQEKDKCQQDLQSARTEGDMSRMELDMHKHRCSSLQSDVSEKILRVLDLAKQYQCKEAEKELGQIRERVEELLRRQKERDSLFVWRSSCELSVQQCRHNCSRDTQELQQRIQGLEKLQKDGEEERKRLQADKEKVGKELEEKRKAAAAMEESLRQQLGVCMGTKVGTWGIGDMGTRGHGTFGHWGHGDSHGDMGTSTSALGFSFLTPGFCLCGNFLLGAVPPLSGATPEQCPLSPQMSHLDLPGSRGPGSAARSSSFPGTGAYMELLKNPAILGTMGMQNPVELQQMLQLMEQYTATLKNASG
uniref:Plasmalemma vesicle associated protein n=1 Tax=Zonotrichia albicollis TaxID=44394 RepID=A0A8D2MHS5_ZONAL